MAGYRERKKSAKAAVDAEARRDLVEAARLWTLAGEPRRAGTCYLRLARRATSDDERISALRSALETLHPEQDAAARGTAELDLARVLLSRARIQGAAGARDRELVAEAAGILERRGETLEAGGAWELLGRPEDAARAYQKGGHVEALERVLESEIATTRKEHDVARRYDAYRLAMEAGTRDRALEAIRLCAKEGPAAAGYEALLRDLEARFPPPGRVAVSIDGRRLEIFGRDGGLTLGRGEADVPLRNLDVSRRHVEIRREGERWTVRDLGSRTGTTLEGVTLGAVLPLPASGRLGLGPSVVLSFSVTGPNLDLEVVDGVDRGRQMRILSAELAIPEIGRSLVFREGRARLVGASEVLLCGARTTDEIVLLVGDVVESGGHRLEVVREA